MERIAVIGAGMGGLATAAILSRRFDVTVFEKADCVGGKVRQIHVDGQPVDSGPTVFTMDWVFEDVFAQAGARLEDHVTKRRLDVLARHAWEDGSTLDLFASPGRSAEAIAAFAGRRDAEAYRSFCDRTRKVFETLKEPFLLAEGPSLGRLMSHRSPVDLMATSPFSSLWQALSKTFHDPRLRQLFGRYATYCGASPFEAPATLMLIAHVEQAGVWALDGGMQAIASALETVARGNGAEFRFGAEVSDISVNGSGVSGLTLASGEEIAADRIVFNGDAAALGAGLLGRGARRAAPPSRSAVRSQSAITWSMRAETTGVPLDMHNVFFSGDYAAEFDSVFKRREPPSRPTVYICAQDRAPGAPAPKGPERLLCLINAPADGDTHVWRNEEIEQCRMQMINQLERCGLTLKCDEEQATTPTDFAKLFPGTGGAIYGMAGHGWRATFQRPGVRTPVPGLYLAGGSVHPGPGVPMAALSGRAAAAALCSDGDSMSRSPRAATPGGTSTR